MSRKDAGHRPNRRRSWTFRLSFLVLFLIAIGACVAVRSMWGPDQANADTPAVRTNPAARGTTPPAPVPAAPVARPAIKTVAVVNGEEITRQQLAQSVLVRYGKEVLQSLVNKHLILQACNERGIVITEADIDHEVDAVAKKFGLSTDRWLQLLATEREISPTKYRRDIIWPTVALRRLAADRLTVTDQEMQEAWESEYGAKVSVRMIALATREEAERVRALALAQPDEFGTLARDNSQDKNSAAARGVIPPIRRYVGHPDIERVVFALNEDEISQVVAAANQFFLFKCERQLPPTRVDPLHASVAQVRLRDRIADGKLRQAAAGLFQQLQQQAQGKIVNVFNDPAMRAQYPGVAAIINGRPLGINELAEECIAQHGLEILDAEINRTVLKQEQGRRNVSVTQQDLDAEIARAADAYGFLKPDSSPDVEAWLAEVTQQEEVTVDLYVQDAVWPSATLKKLVRASVEVTEEDLRKGFEANYGERVEVLAIVLASQRRAVEVFEMARAKPTDAWFGDLAHQYSIEPVSKANFGVVPPLRRHGGQPLLEEEAFCLAAGEMSGVIVAGDKYILLRCLGRTKPVVKQLADVKDELYKDIYEKKLRIAMADEFDRLKQSARIENFLANTRQDGRPMAGAVRPAGHVTPDARYGATIRGASQTSPTGSGTPGR